MNVERRTPHEGHHVLMRELGGVCDQAQANGLSRVDQMAVLAQLIGSHMHHLPANAGFTPQMLLEFVARNIHLGNQHASGSAGIIATPKGEA